MKRHGKRMIGMLLIGVTLMAAMTVVTHIPPGEDTFATESAQRLKDFSEGKILRDTVTETIQDDGRVKVVLKGYSYKGRDACFQQFENGVLTGESYVDHSEDTITSYSRGETEPSVQNVHSGIKSDPQ